MVEGELDWLVDDFERYAESFLRVQDKQSLRVVGFRLKPVQRRLARTIMYRFWLGVPVRVIVLKARREGVSTLVQALFFWLCATRPDQASVTVSHHDDTTRQLHGIAERFDSYLDSAVRPMKRQAQRGYVLEFANPSRSGEERQRNPGLQSVLRTVTFDNAGAGTAANLLHCSEVGLWRDRAKEVLDTLLQVVPSSGGSIVVLESTARGVGNEFHRRWKAAELAEASGREDGYVPFFIPWFEEPTNVMAADGVADLDVDEQWLVDVCGCSLEQVAWRRWAIENLCGGDLRTFHQEYPASADEAFLASGDPYFDPVRVVERREEQARDAWLVGELVEEERDGGLVGRVVARRRGRLRVWEPPVEGEDYLVVCDPSEGSAEDPQAVTVWPRRRAEVVAAWHGYEARDDLGDVLYVLGRLYNSALVVVETTGGWGWTPISVLRARGYERIYRRRAEKTQRRKRGVVYGWETTPTNRALALDHLAELFRGDEFHCPDAMLYEQALTFVIADGKPQAQPGCHDDVVMANAVAAYLWHTEPRYGLNHEAPAYHPVSATAGY